MGSADRERRAVAIGRLCSVDGCERGGISQIEHQWVCNLHYLRNLMHSSFALPPRELSRNIKCARCGSDFDRGYAINAKRASNPQFCSNACRASQMEEQSLAGAEERFWLLVDKRGPDDCWEWTGYRGANGYGRFTWRRDRTQTASRIAYHFSKGDPGNKFVCHSCDNPPCCNPAHLWLGTHEDNMADMSAKGRAGTVTRVGCENPNAKLNEEIVRKIRASGLTNKELAAQYGVTGAAIYQVRAHKNWAWVS